MSRPLSLSPNKPSERELRFHDFERVLKFVALLGSSNENEVAAAVKQLTAAMAAVDLSWSDVAESIRKIGLGDVKPAKRPRSWSQMDQGQQFGWLQWMKDRSEFEGSKTWLIEVCDRYCVSLDARYLANLPGTDELLNKARRLASPREMLDRGLP